MNEIIVASIGLFASILTGSISFYLTKKNQLKMEERRLKEEFYKAFIKALSDVAIDNDDDVAQKRLSEGFNSLLVMAGLKVVKNLMAYHDFVRAENKTIPRDSEDWHTRHNELLSELMKSIREDLFGKEKGGEEIYPLMHLVGRKPKRELRPKK